MKLCIQDVDSASRRVYEFASATVSVGRDSDCDLPLGEVASVSGHHLRITLASEGAYLVDLNSTNGTLLNDRSVQGQARIRKGDYFRLGHTGPTFQIVDLDLSPEVRSAPKAPVPAVDDDRDTVSDVDLHIEPDDPVSGEIKPSIPPSAPAPGRSAPPVAESPVSSAPDFKPLTEPSSESLASSIEPAPSADYGQRAAVKPAREPVKAVAHEVFISFSSKDLEACTQVFDRLTEAGFACWKSNKGIKMGRDWETFVLHQLDTARVFVLLLSEKSMKSVHVRNEVNRAVGRQESPSFLKIVPFHVDATPLRGAFELSLGRIQSNVPTLKWRDDIEDLVEAVRIALEEAARDRDEEFQRITKKPVQPLIKRIWHRLVRLAEGSEGSKAD